MAKEVKLKESSVFYLQAVLNSVPLDKLGEVKKSKFKAITMRRKLVKQLNELNEEFRKKVEAFVEIKSKYQKEYQEFAKEMNERYDLDEQKALEGVSEEEKEAKKEELKTSQGVEKQKELDDFATSVQEKMDAEVKATGLKFLMYTMVDPETKERKSVEIVEYANKEDEKELTIELTDDEDGQYKFAQRLFEENAMTAMPVEDILLPIAEVLELS